MIAGLGKVPTEKRPWRKEFFQAIAQELRG